MSEQILNPKIEADGLIDVVLIGASKKVTETMLTPYVGNATIRSGIVKGILGGVIHGKFGKAGKIIGSGLVIDAAEDIATVFMSGAGIASGGQPQNEWA